MYSKMPTEFFFRLWMANYYVTSDLTNTEKKTMLLMLVKAQQQC